MEVVRLRVNDIDFDQLQLRIWNGKGFKHRLTTLAPELVPQLDDQMQRVALQLKDDLKMGSYAGVWMPEALAREVCAAHSVICKKLLCSCRVSNI